VVIAGVVDDDNTNCDGDSDNDCSMQYVSSVNAHSSLRASASNTNAAWNRNDDDDDCCCDDCCAVAAVDANAIDDIIVDDDDATRDDDDGGEVDLVRSGDEQASESSMPLRHVLCAVTSAAICNAPTTNRAPNASGTSNVSRCHCRRQRIALIVWFDATCGNADRGRFAAKINSALCSQK
jgi:hypothetical protein